MMVNLHRYEVSLLSAFPRTPCSLATVSLAPPCLLLAQAFEKYCKLPVAYGAYPNVNNVNAGPEDRMESFFLGETLKYLYLIQDPENEVDITKVVFNTEAHPMHIFGASATFSSPDTASSS